MMIMHAMTMWKWLW